MMSFWIQREREREREILKFGMSLWYIDKHGVVLTVRERERDRQTDRQTDRNTQTNCYML